MPKDYETVKAQFKGQNGDGVFPLVSKKERLEIIQNNIMQGGVGQNQLYLKSNRKPVEGMKLKERLVKGE